MLGTDKAEIRRFTISLEASAYEELRHIAASHQPPLSIQFVVRYILLRFLEDNKNRQLTLDID